MKTIISIFILMIGWLVLPSFVSGNDLSVAPVLSAGSGTVAAITPNAISDIVSNVNVQVDGSVSEFNQATVGVQTDGGGFLLKNWGALLMGLLGLADLVTRLTPSEKDNSIVNFLISIFNVIIPNLKKGGGVF